MPGGVEMSSSETRNLCGKTPRRVNVIKITHISGGGGSDWKERATDGVGLDVR